jgi:hypothetical protein
MVYLSVAKLHPDDGSSGPNTPAVSSLKIQCKRVVAELGLYLPAGTVISSDLAADVESIADAIVMKNLSGLIVFCNIVY